MDNRNLHRQEMGGREKNLSRVPYPFSSLFQRANLGSIVGNGDCTFTTAPLNTLRPLWLRPVIILFIHESRKVHTHSCSDSHMQPLLIHTHTSKFSSPIGCLKLQVDVHLSTFGFGENNQWPEANGGLKKGK